MKKYVVSLLACASMGAVVLAGCAQGVEPDPDVDRLTTLPEESEEEEQATVKIPPPSNPDQTIGHDGDADKDDADPDDGDACAAPQPCAGATDLGSVSGDTGADVLTVEGSSSQWFRVYVTEDDNDIFGVPLSVAATLTSPPGTNFDLYVYVPSSPGDSIECSAVHVQSTGSGSLDAARAEFGETGTFSNGRSDARYVTIEVRHVSGTCNPSEKWKLTIEGNK